MLLGGLWHGAAWNFVIWGGYHGLLLAGEQKYREFRGSHAPSRPRFIGTHCPRGVHVFAVALGWVLFRGHDMTHAGADYAALAGVAPPQTGNGPLVESVVSAVPCLMPVGGSPSSGVSRQLGISPSGKRREKENLSGMCPVSAEHRPAGDAAVQSVYLLLVLDLFLSNDRFRLKLWMTYSSRGHARPAWCTLSGRIPYRTSALKDYV